MENIVENRHYISTDQNGCILDGWSDGPISDRDIAGAILLRSDGGYQFRLSPGGLENPQLKTADGIPLYRWNGASIVPRTEKEIAADRAVLPVAQSADERLYALETETAAISAAIERGLSL